jgi:hypothetical protein
VLEEKKVCAAIFLDVAQAFDKVWHEGLACKLKTILPKQYAEILDSYLTERFFRIKQGNAYSELKEINVGVCARGQIWLIKTIIIFVVFY